MIDLVLAMISCCCCCCAAPLKLAVQFDLFVAQNIEIKVEGRVRKVVALLICRWRRCLAHDVTLSYLKEIGLEKRGRSCWLICVVE